MFKVIKVTICGAAGRMGQRLVRLVSENPDLSLAGAVDRKESPYLGLDAGHVSGVGTLGVPITDDFPKAVEGSRLYIDFSTPEGVEEHVKVASRLGVAAVIGVTGLGEETNAAIKEASGNVPVIIAPNMSFGVNLMYKLVAEAAAILGREYEIEIVETHHNRKKDAPSGTALTLLERLAQARGLDPANCGVYGRHGMPGARGKDEIGVHAVRGGEIVGDHKVIFAGPGEVLEITHRSQSRDALAGGAIRAASWIIGKPPGVYTFKEVLGL
jgi:4-hydroxy-tetrahydrodipicolinate reductase